MLTDYTQKRAESNAPAARVRTLPGAPRFEYHAGTVAPGVGVALGSPGPGVGSPATRIANVSLANRSPFRRETVLAALTLALALGWASRELAFAREKDEAARSQTITLDQVTMDEFRDQGKPAGKIGIYLKGDTPASSNFVTGRFVLDPGKTPHAPHTHAEEEVMVIESGHGEIFCDGKTTKIGPGSVMYTAPNAPHGIVNTGDTPIVFYFIKWAEKAAK